MKDILAELKDEIYCEPNEAQGGHIFLTPAQVNAAIQEIESLRAALHDAIVNQDFDDPHKELERIDSVARKALAPIENQP